MLSVGEFIMSEGIQVIVIVEGHTEQMFINSILAPHLAHRNIYLTSPLIGLPGHKGGRVTFNRAGKDIMNFLKQRSNTIVTTMFDFYGLDSKWPGKERAMSFRDYMEKAKYLEDSTYDAICKSGEFELIHNRFIPYFSMHEFEAILFSHPQTLAQVLNIDLDKIQQICNSFNNPEQIDDDPQSAPSKRIYKLSPRFRKIVDSNTIINQMGLEQVRQTCPHFNEWVTRLQNLTSI